MALILQLANHALRFPTQQLYLKGPSWGSWGFWGGRAPEDICHILTGVDSEFWVSSESAQWKCMEMIDRQYMGYTILFVHLCFILLISVFLCKMARCGRW